MKGRCEMRMWKVTTIENQNRQRYILADAEEAGILMEFLADRHAPKPWRGELYKLRFEVETVDDENEEIDFEELTDLLADGDEFVDELEVEDVKEDE